jgi:hypothetical protein
MIHEIRDVAPGMFKAQRPITRALNARTHHRA